MVKKTHLSTFLSKIMKYNRPHLGGDPAFVRLLGHDPTPIPTCPIDHMEETYSIAGLIPCR